MAVATYTYDSLPVNEKRRYPQSTNSQRLSNKSKPKRTLEGSSGLFELSPFHQPGSLRSMV